jgi:hypothetical protein
MAADPTLRKRAATRAAKSEQQANELSPPADDDDVDGAGGTNSLPSHRVATTPQGEPTDKAQRNFTDPDSCIMVRNGVFLQAYNAYRAVGSMRALAS